MPLAFPQLAVVSPGTPITSALWMSSVYNGLTYMRNPPLAVLVQNNAQAVWNGYAAITFDSTIVDTYGGHSNTTSNSRYVCQDAGWYEVSGIVAFGSNTTGVRDAFIGKNGVNPNYTTLTANPVGGSTPTCVAVASVPIQLAVGDYVELYGLSGTTGNVGTVAGSSVMVVRSIHA